MIWNLSEVEYDVSILEDQVLLFSFPGSPSPPLGLLLKLLISMESWLKADERNVAVVHCLTGKGRTSTVVAAFLCWMGEAGFRDVHKALDYIAQCKRCPANELTIPSQRRYVQYFANMLDGVRPSQPPLMLKRIILSEAPKFAKGPPRENTPPPPDDSNDVYDPDHILMGCAPYLQIFKAGQLVFTTAASLHYNQPKDDLPFCQIADGPISFHVENVVQGDILVRCRHLTAQGQRVSMFRAAFHTGYAPPTVMRLTKAQLDGACTDKRFADDFFLDLIFEPCDAEMASKHLSGKADGGTDDNNDENEQQDKVESQNEASERRQKGTLMGLNTATAEQQLQQKARQDAEQHTATVTASAYDSMLHRDSRFWDVIAARRQEHAKVQQEDTTTTAPATGTVEGGGEQTAEGKDLILWGPTIGRRRNFEALAEKSKKGGEGADGTTSDTVPVPALETFSIGGDFDFITPEETPPTPQPKKKDALMDMLDMAIDDETASPMVAKKTKIPAVPSDTEEIVFDEEAVKKVEPKGLFKAEESEKAETADTEQESVEVPKEEQKKPEDVDEVAALLDDTDLGMDTDVDAFLASAEVGDGNEDDDIGDDVDLDLDFDDDELEDLENFLTQK